MHRFFAAGVVLILLLMGCGAEENPVVGKWRGEISEEQRSALLIPPGETEDVLVAEFLSATAVLNGNMRPVEHRKNEETYYVNEIGTDRTMAVQFPEPNRMKLMMPHRFKAEIVVLYLNKVPATP
ncbi:MAG: hypothetical protein ISP41_00855 [Alphaproteobacteria bacterium]|jgi:hypothetical protein|nr:hypothetical protein [Alphaproteobacteria bacterium]